MGINFDAETGSVPDDRRRPSTEWQGGTDALPFKNLPRKLDGYRILDEIARGGMGVVFRGLDTKREREVAIKFMLAGGKASAGERARFEREGKALEKVRDPNIVALRGFGEYEGMPYLVMDLIKGESLQDRLDRKGPLKPQRAAEITRKLALALEAAHEREIIHRDIKPDNVLLNAEREPMLTDFGLATAAEEVSNQLTRSGAALGTPGYWAPEQVRGDRGALGPHTDVWGLGATLYAMLTQRPPFDGTSLYDIMSATLEEEPTPLSKLRPSVDADLERICSRCLEKDPAKRYSDTAALADDLERYARGKSLGKRSRETARLPPPKRAPKTAEDPEPPFPLGAMLVGLLVTSLFVFAIWRSWNLNKTDPEVAGATTPRDDATEEPKRGSTPGPRPLPRPEPTVRDRAGATPARDGSGVPAHIQTDLVKVSRSRSGPTIDQYGRALAATLKRAFVETEVETHHLTPKDPKRKLQGPVIGRGFVVRMQGLLACRMSFASLDDALEYVGYALDPTRGAFVVAEQRARQVVFLVGPALKDVDLARVSLRAAWRTTPSVRPRSTELVAIAVIGVGGEGSFGGRVFVPKGSLREAAWNAVRAGRKFVKQPGKGMKVEFLDDAKTHLWFETGGACSEVRVSSKRASYLFGKTRDGVAETSAYLLKLARQVR